MLMALISAGVVALASVSGTAIGAAAGCWLATQVVSGSASCDLGGFVAGFLGSFINPLLAAVAVPIGVGTGIAINTCLAFVLGAILYGWLLHSRMLYRKQALLFGLIKTIPIINDLPAFTFMAVRCVIQKNLEEKKLQQSPSKTSGAMLAPGTALGTATAGVYALNRYSGRRAVEAGVDTEARQTAWREDTKKRASTDLKNMDGIYAKQGQRASSPTPQAEAPNPLYV